MGWLTAGAIAAKVVDLKPVRNRAHHCLVVDAVHRALSAGVITNDGVALVGFMPHPFQAAILTPH
jgi:hypothetical protein